MTGDVFGLDLFGRIHAADLDRHYSSVPLLKSVLKLVSEEPPTTYGPRLVLPFTEDDRGTSGVRQGVDLFRGLLGNGTCVHPNSRQISAKPTFKVFPRTRIERHSRCHEDLLNHLRYLSR